MVRTAGHVVDPGVLGSVEYGVRVLGIGLVVVLGHDACGLVRPAAGSMRTGATPPGYIRDVIERIAPAVFAVQRSQHPPDLAGGQAPLDCIEAEHIRGTATWLVERSRILTDVVRGRSCHVLGATYRRSDGRVRLVSVEA